MLLLTVPEAAHRLSLKSRSTVYEMVHAGELAATEGRGGLRIPESALAEYIADRTVKALPRTPKPVRPRARPPTIVGGGQDVMARKTVRSARKRARKGEGTVFYDDSRGCWVGQIDLGADPGTGKRRRPKVSGPDEQTVWDLLDELKAERKSTGTVAPRDMTVRMALDDWVANPSAKVRSHLSLASHRNNAALITDGGRGVPGLGGKLLHKLTVDQVEKHLRMLTAAGYSAETISRVRAAGKSAVRRVMRGKGIMFNVFDLSEMPAGGGKRVSRSASKNDVLALFASDLDVWWRAYFSVGILVGLRPGERLGLRWEDVDFAAGIIRVRVMLRRVERDGRKVFELGDLKTDRSARAETMPADVAAALTALRRAQAKDRLRYGRDYGSGLDNCAKGLVFCGKHGEPRHGQAILKKMKDLFEAAGLGRDWVPRDQRKTFGTVMRKLGKAPMADVSAAMGHSAIGVTDRVYVGVYPEDVADVASVMDKVFPPGSTAGQGH